VWQLMSGEMNPRPADSASSGWKERESQNTQKTHAFSVSITFAISHMISKRKPDTYLEELLSISFLLLFFCGIR